MLAPPPQSQANAAQPEAERNRRNVEKFEPRIISSEPIDADRIGVTAGLEPDLRVVTRGAELINQIR